MPTTCGTGLFIQSQTRLYGLRRQRKRAPAGQPPVLSRLPYWTNYNSIPNESKKLPNKRDPLYYSPPDIDMNNLSTKLCHLSSCNMNKLGHEDCRYLLVPSLFLFLSVYSNVVVNVVLCFLNYQSWWGRLLCL